MGRIEEGNAEIRRAQELDPLSLIINSIVGIGYMIKGSKRPSYRAIKEDARDGFQFSASAPFLAKSYENKKLFEEAITRIKNTFYLMEHRLSRKRNC
jgi:hypothetical protein